MDAIPSGKIMDRLTKSAQFLQVKATHSIAKLAKRYVKHIGCRHSVPASIEFNRGSIFTSRFGKKKIAGGNGHQT